MSSDNELQPSFGEKDLSDDLFAEYLSRSNEGEKLDVANFLQSRGFSNDSVETFRKELRGYERYRNLLQARTLDGQKIGRYQLIRELGRGGMGRVYLAEDIEKNRQVALKLLTSVERPSVQARERFRREYEMVASLHHPHIIPMYDAGEEDGFRYYAMEYISGFTLDQVIKRVKARDISRIRAEDVGEAVGGKGPLWRGTYIDWVCWILSSVGEALAHAHRRGIIHRDVKPSNILLSHAGRPYLFDFGLAVGTRGTRITKTGEILGTPVYMAPEQIEGGKKPLDQRTDVYGLGATLYEMLTLRVPFEGDSPHEVAHRILFDQPARPRKFNSTIPGSLEAICMTALSKEPSRRYTTVRAMVQDLRNYFSYRPIQARTLRPFDRIRSFTKKRPIVAASVFAALLILPMAGMMIHDSSASVFLEKGKETAHEIHNALESFAIEDWENSKAHCARALQLDPQEGQAQALRGLIYQAGMKDEKSALEDYQAALEQRPTHLGIRRFLAGVKGDPNPLRRYQDDPSFDEEAPSAWDHFFDGLYLLIVDREFKEAKLAFDRALNLDRGLHIGLLYRGLAYQKLGQWENSESDLNTYTYIYRDNPIGYLLHSRSLYQMNRKEASTQIYGRALRLIQDKPRVWGFLDSVSSQFLPGAPMTAIPERPPSGPAASNPLSH